MRVKLARQGLLKRVVHLFLAGGLLPMILLCPTGASAGNDPGGGTNGVGPDVTLTDNGTSVTLSNGIITAQITKATAQVTSMKFMGREMVQSGGNIYFSMDGGSSYEQPASGIYTIKTNSADMVNVSFGCTLTTYHAFTVEIHYVLRRGDTGLYVYATLRHPANYATTSYGEWRMVWKMNQDPLERIYVDEIRNWQQPSQYDLDHAQTTDIAEIIKLTTGIWAGRYDCKYMYNVEYQKVGCYGHASNTNKIGAWIVFGGYDFFNDGPTKQDLAPASGINHVHFGRNHYNGSGLYIPNGEFWSKNYGPFLLYCNTNWLGGEACWADAKAQVEAETGAWPYAWLTGATNYPLAGQRGAVSGTLVFTDALKPAVSAAGAWVGLADPSLWDWQWDSKFYQYWSRADSNGNFVIPNVRPGTYTLHAFNVGALGEFSQASVTVAAAATNNLGTLVWNVPHSGGYLAWEIGVPDRLATEFRHGTNYWEPYIWDSFAKEFANPLEYNLDSANPAWDWNYAHNFYGPGLAVWSWNVNFNLPATPPADNAWLAVATAGGESAHLYVYVNGSKQGDFYPYNAGGNTLLRQGVHDKYDVNYVVFPAATYLHAGSNTITFQEVSSTPATVSHTMYDYIALELPGTAPAVQFLTWQGGNAANCWDAGVTTNWYAYGNSQVFSNGLKVLFNDPGDNAPVRLADTLTPASVVVNATKDYVFSGTGSLAGAMPLTKKGPGTLYLVASNSYTGDTTIESGTLRVSTVEPAAVANGGFEKPLLASGTWTTPAAGPWRFGLTPGQSQGTAGIASGPGQWSPSAAEGGQYCYFWQSGMAAQDVYLPAGSYTVSFWLVGRKTSTGATYPPADLAFQVVQAGATNIVATWPSDAQTYSWSQKTAAFTITNSGTGTLIFAASQPAGNPSDWGSDIDDVRIAFNNAGLAAAGLPGSSRVVLGTNGILDLNGFSETTGPLGDLNGAGGVVTNSGFVPMTLTLNSPSGSNSFSGAIADAGASNRLALVKAGSGTQVLAGSLGFHGDIVVSDGTLKLQGNALPTNSPMISMSGGAMLDVGELPGGGLWLGSGQALKGNGTVIGDITIASGATLSPGASVGTLVINGNLALDTGAVLNFELGSTNASDMVVASGALALGGTLNVTNLDGFGTNTYLLSAYGGTLSGSLPTIGVMPAGFIGSINTNTPGQVKLVVQTAPRNPTVFGSISLCGGNLTLNGSGGTSNGMYYVLASTNVTLPLAQWQFIVTNQFDTNGNFTVPNLVYTNSPQRFYLLRLQ